MHGLHERRAHVRELDEVLGPDLDVGARVEQQERRARDGDDDRQRRAGARRGARLKRNSEAASAAPVEPPETSASASPGGDRRDGLHDRGLRASRRTARAGSAALAIETGASTTSTPSGTAPISAAGPEQEHADAARGGAGGAARDLSGAVVGPVGVDRDGDWAASA